MKRTVKTRKLFNCICDSEGEITEQDLVSITQFDESGNVVREEIFEEGELAILVENTFVGALLQKTEQTDYVNQIQQVWEYIFDDLGRKTEKREHFQEGGFIPTKYEYNIEGKLTSESVIDDDGNPESKIEYHYDSIGNVIKKVEYDTDDFTSPWVSTSYEYDINKNLVKKEEQFADKDATTSVYEYDEAGALIGGQVFYSEDEDLIVDQKIIEDEEGNVIGTVILNPKENLKRESFVKKNEEGKVIEEETLINGNFNNLTLINYNENGDPIEQKYLNTIGNGEYQQWTAKAYELEYFENTNTKDEEE